MILVLTLVVLLVLSMAAGASLINGLLQRSQARAEANAAIALHAAEAGVAAGMAWLSDPNNIDDYHYPSHSGDVPDPTLIDEVATPGTNEAYTTKTEWQEWSHPLSGSFGNGGSYEATVRFKRERRDRNDDGDCCDKYPDAPLDEDSEYSDGDANPCTVCPGEVVLFNNGSGDGGFHIPDSHFILKDQGFPVVEIESVGAQGASAVREVALFVARNSKAQVEGAFTTRTPVNATTLNKEIDGTNAGSPACGGDLPGITFDIGMPLPCDVNSDGVCDTDECKAIDKIVGVVCAKTADRELSKTPWDALGMTEVDFRAFFKADDSGALDTNTCKPGEFVYLWFTGDLTDAKPKKTCEGILVVHNPRFDPDKWDPAAAGYDAAYAGDLANAPASLAYVGSGNFTWNGIVIADQVGKITGNLEMNGGVISLASGGAGVITDLQGSVSINYDCDKVAAVTKRIGYKKKIGWQRVR